MHQELDAKKASKSNATTLIMLIVGMMVGQAQNAFAGAVQGPTALRGAVARARAVASEDGGAVRQGAGKIIVGSLIFMVSLVIGLILYPIVTAAQATALNDTNTPEQDKPLIGILSLLFILLLFVGGAALVFDGIKDLRG